MVRFTRGLMRYRPLLFLVNLVVWTLSHMAPLLPGYVTKVYYDGLAGAGPVVITPVLILVILASIGLTRGLFGVTGEWLWGDLWTRVTGLVRLNLFRRVAAQPAALATPRSSSETVSRVRDDVEEACMPIEEFTDSVGVIGFAVGAIAIMASIDWLIAGIVIIPIVLSSLTVELVRARVTGLRRASRSAGANVAEFIGEVFSSFVTFKLATSAEGAPQRLQRLNDLRRRAVLREKVLAQLLEGISDGTAVVCTAILLFYISSTAAANTLTVGEFILFVTYLDRVADYAQWMMGMLVNVKRAKVSVGRLLQTMAAGSGVVELTTRDPVGTMERNTAVGRSASLQRLEVCAATYLHPTTNGSST